MKKSAPTKRPASSSATAKALVGKSYLDMTAAELAAATDRYDAPMPEVRPGVPLPPRVKAKHDRFLAAARKQAAAGKAVGSRPVGRPKVGRGAAAVLVSIERGLLADADTYAKKLGKSRSELIAEGLRRVMGKRSA